MVDYKENKAPEKPKDEKDDKNKLCSSCTSWKHFGDKCYFFWHHKKACSQFRKSDFADPEFHEIKDWVQG